MKQTKSTKPVSEKSIAREWHLVDMRTETLGRVATTIARYLQGKHRTGYVPYLDTGDYVVVINSNKVNVSGRKSEAKAYSYYSGYPGGLRTTNFKNLKEKNPNEIVRHAVSGMLPKNKLREQRLTRLYIFPDENHTYKDKIR